MACLTGVSERSTDVVPKFRNFSHVNAPHWSIKPESPTRRSVSLFLRSKNADKVLIVERRDDERMIHYPINLGLAGKMRNVKLASADCFHIRQRGPDNVFDTGILGGAYRSGCL